MCALERRTLFLGSLMRSNTKKRIVEQRSVSTFNYWIYSINIKGFMQARVYNGDTGFILASLYCMPQRRSSPSATLQSQCVPACSFHFSGGDHKLNTSITLNVIHQQTSASVNIEMNTRQPHCFWFLLWSTTKLDIKTQGWSQTTNSLAGNFAFTIAFPKLEL